MAGPFQSWDIGGCNCGCGCSPCNLPATGLHLTEVNSGVTTQVFPIAYQGGCLWGTCNVTIGGSSSIRTVIGCSSGCSYILNYNYLSNTTCTGTPSNVSGWESTVGCSGVAITGNRWTLNAGWTCSPLNVVWQDGINRTWTLTL